MRQRAEDKAGGIKRARSRVYGRSGTRARYYDVQARA